MTDESTGLSMQDAKLIAAAASDGRISDPLVWIDAIKADPQGTRRVLASLPKAWTRMRTVAASTPVTINAANEPTVRGGGTNPPPAPPVGPTDKFGLPVAQMPEPVLLRKGTNVEDYTQEQQFDRFMNMLGGQFKASAKPLPQGDSWYLPSPNDTSEFKNGQWVLKNPYKEV
jgi:hypothetical protein